MTNIYDVLSQLHTKATGSVEESVKEELAKEAPPIAEARAILEAEADTEAGRGTCGPEDPSRDQDALDAPRQGKVKRRVSGGSR